MNSQVVHPAFERLAEAFPRAVRKSRGAALAVYHRGQLVVDLWTGTADSAAGRAWERDTVAMAWSTTKGVTSAAIHLLVQRGLLRLDTTVGSVWPEFAANGKRYVTVTHLLAQEAGLHDIRHLIGSGSDLLSHGTIADALAKAAPAYPPGTENSYHALTYGYLADELIRRTDGRTLSDFVTAEFQVPLDLDGFGLSLSERDAQRLAPPPPAKPLFAGARPLARTANLVTRHPPLRLDLRAIASAFIPPNGDVIGTPAFLAAGNGSIGGTFTARALAKFYSALIGDQPATIWNPETLRTATNEHSHRRDKVIPLRPNWHLGYHQPWPRKKIDSEAFGFYGLYGSGAWADPNRRLAIALVTPDARNAPLLSLNKTILSIADHLSRRQQADWPPHT